MAERDQARPLAPSSRDQQQSSDEELAPKSNRHRKIKLCGFVTLTFILLLVIVIVILVFTVFKAKDPKIKANSIILTNLDLSVNPISSVYLNMSLLIDMSIKNPNYASFKFSNTSTSIYYHGVEIAEARTLPGKAKARRTMKLNVTADVMTDRLVSSQDFIRDVVGTKQMTLNSYTVVAGRVKVLIIKKHIEVRMNCTFTVSISNSKVQGINCQHKVER